MKKINGLNIVSLLLALGTLGLSFFQSEFIPSCMLMLSLFVFSICYNLKDANKKILLYILFCIGIILIAGSLIYTGLRIS